MWKFSRILLACAFLPFLCVLLLAQNVIQMASLVILPLAPRLFRKINRLCARIWFNSLALLLEAVLRVKFVQTGDPLPPNENVFVVANHQSGADIPALVVLAFRCGRTGDLKWFVKDPIKWVPGVGWGMLFLDCLFVKRNWSADKDKIIATFGRLRRYQVPFWILSFVEGTRLKPAKLERAQEFCRKAGLPVLQNVMSPRTKGFEATLDGLGSMTDAVYDITIAYENFPLGRVPGLTALFFGTMQRIHIDVRRFPAASLPQDAAGRVQWILERFVVKDKRLADFYRTGRLG